MEIKKTMKEALAFVTDNGNMSAENLELFTANYCIAKVRVKLLNYMMLKVMY